MSRHENFELEQLRINRDFQRKEASTYGQLAEHGGPYMTNIDRAGYRIRSDQFRLYAAKSDAAYRARCQELDATPIDPII